MKAVARIFTIALLAFLTSAAASAQAPDLVQKIRQQYADINRNAAKYRTVRKELSGFSAEGGELIAYFKGPSIVKMVATYFGETGRATEEFYYANDNLIFVFRKDSRYNEPLSGKVVSTAESRFYFKQDKLIGSELAKWIDGKGRQISPGDPEFKTKGADYLATSKEFIKGARSKNPIIESEP